MVGVVDQKDGFSGQLSKDTSCENEIVEVSVGDGPDADTFK